LARALTFGLGASGGGGDATLSLGARMALLLPPLQHFCGFGLLSTTPAENNTITGSSAYLIKFDYKSKHRQKKEK